ncbi:MAG: 30S ribosome-binding factor RbfA [Defluviitaleaceae bacterium]|nr:30S ribosome-binding factor RbfA [Defluviitaleaceae bacterium]
MKNNKRLTRIGDEIARVTAGIIRSELADPRIGTVTSVLRADIVNDLKYCTVSVSILGNEKQRDQSMEALRSATGYIRKRIAETINLRVTPEITFVFDNSIERGMIMQKKIDEVINSDRERVTYDEKKHTQAD